MSGNILQRSNGRPEPEVIMNFGDGFSYVKGKLDEAYIAVVTEKEKEKKPKEVITGLKKEDVDLLMNEFEISRPQAEKALAANDKDVTKTIHALIKPPE
ncbi:hypothetical protein VNI00_009422 [Paramarasmius palmivorus]|uniref:Nascent polypeptide-associated complex subunit alpha-like UBA domain-containing protein n=1 Tax=Paramarasmius palmivorus TaxID=297713 RepID=A0AAW0CQJ2_9AGAR